MSSVGPVVPAAMSPAAMSPAPMSPAAMSPAAMSPAAMSATAASPAAAFPAAAARSCRPVAIVPIDLAVLAARRPVTLRLPPDRPDRPDRGAVAVSGLTLRASDVRPGDLFAALPGARAHGADHAARALAAGAVAVLTDPGGATRPALADVPLLIHPRPRTILGDLAVCIYGDPTAALPVIGVTGTSGKTTVTHLLEAGLVAAGRTPGVVGTIGTRIAGDPIATALTTPEAPDLQALFAAMVQAGVTEVAMEVSSHALALGRVVGTRFAVAAFTNLSQDHLDFHADMDDYFATKARLFDGRARRAVIGVDDVWGRRLADRTPGAVTVSITGPADWSARDIVADPRGGQQFSALTPAGPLPVRLRLPGAFNVANALVALACLDAVGVDTATAAAAFADLAVPGRMQPVAVGQPWLAIVDYAHKPAAVAALLDTLRAQVPGRLLTVLGCGGDRDRGKRPLMGAAAAARSALLVVTDDNPRSEDPAAIRAAMLAGARGQPGAPETCEVREIGDRRAAIAAAVAAARPGDAVVIAGKGHETGQEIAGRRHPFDDAAELAGAIEAARPWSSPS